MDYLEVLPSIHLRKYIKCFWQLEHIEQFIEDSSQPIFPDGNFELVFNLADRFQRFQTDGSIEIQPQTILVGQMRRAVKLKPTGKICLFGIRFQPAGAFPLFKFSLSQLQDKIEDVETIWGKFGKEFAEKIQYARNFYERLIIAENIFTQRIDFDADQIVKSAIKLISESRGKTKIEFLAASNGISWRQFERKFQREVGLSPKTYCRIIRLQNVLQSLQNKPQNNLLDLALSFGYYDQAHLIHEFKDFTGISPLMFVKNEKNLSKVFIKSD